MNALADDLLFTQDHGIQTGSDPKEVVDAIAFPTDVEKPVYVQ